VFVPRVDRALRPLEIAVEINAMNSIAFARGLRFIVVAALLNITGAIEQMSVGQVATDPSLTLTINGTNQNVVLTWFGEDGVAYQLETSADLTTWTNFGQVIIGTGNSINVPHSIAGENQRFFRLKRLPPDPTSAVFDPLTGILTITGNNIDNTIVVSRDAAGVIRVNNGAVSISGGTATIANTTLIQIFGRAGNDQLSLDESNGAMPKANMFGEAGNDTLTGGSGDDMLNGGVGDDTLFGRGGADSLFGGDNNDTLTGGDGDDQVFGEADNERMIWNPGDDTDLNEGGSGTDTVEVNGGNGAEIFTTTANGTRVRFDRTSPAPFALDIGTSENLVLNANGGNDSFSATGNLAALIRITVDGGAGDDTLLGSNGADVLLGGDNNDFIDGQQGDDVAFLGAGDDTFQWDPGDGNDTIEGQAGSDTLLFNGNGANEIFNASANGSRVRFTRDVGNIVMDLDDVENLALNALGGVDAFTVNDLAGTDLSSITADLAGTLGGSSGDAQLDVITVNGTEFPDTISIIANAGTVEVSGLAALVRIRNSEQANDDLIVNGLGGVDTITIGPGVTTLIDVTANQ
jgi:Ca2+-binding RTX toxin-like protein